MAANLPTSSKYCLHLLIGLKQQIEEENPSSSVRHIQYTTSKYNSLVKQHILYHILWHVSIMSSKNPKTVTQLSRILNS
jgi:hypothetical protein